jgi:molecular chaperone DnaJ
MQSHYETLGISKSASLDEIKSAYRKLSKQFHPDVNKDDGAEEKFKQINEAYSVLSDPAKKAEYDRPHAPAPNFNEYNFVRTQQFNTPVNLRVTLTLEEVFQNITKIISYNRRVFCKECVGEGGKGNKNACRTCMGSGQVVHTIQHGNFFFQQSMGHCGDCVGKGWKFDIPCSVCQSQGIVVETFQDSLTVNKGEIFNAVFKPGWGNWENAKEPPAKAIIEFGIAPHQIFEFDNQGNVHLKLNLDPVEIMCGTNKKVKFPNGEEKLINIPKLFNINEVILFQKDGIPKPNNDFGSFLITLVYKNPDSLTEKQESVLKEYIATLES